MTKERKFKDIYNIVDMPGYIHSSYLNMKNIQKNNFKGENIYEEIKSSMKMMIISLIQDLIWDWEGIRKSFIEHGKNFGIEEEDPDGFLKRFNSEFNRMREKTFSGKLLDFRDFSFEIKQLKSSTSSKTIAENKIKIAEKVENNFLKVMNFLEQSYNYEEIEKINRASLIFGENALNSKEKKKKDEMIKNPTNLQKEVVNSLKRAFPGLQVQKINELFNVMKSETNPDKKLKFLESFFDTQVYRVVGLLGEELLDKDMANDEFFKNFIPVSDEDQKLRKEASTTLTGKTIGDNLIASFNYNGQNIKLFTSIKIRDEMEIKSSYAILEQGILNFTSMLNFSNDFEKLKWIRQNMISLSIFNKEDEKINLEDFYDNEEVLGSYYLIPRFLDGLYDFQEKKLAPQYGKSRIHTALFFSKGKFYWMVDILKNILNKLKEGKEDFAFRTSKPIYSPIPINKEDLEELYQTKRKIIGELKKIKSWITYKKISEMLPVFYTNKFSKWAPLNKLTIAVKYGNLV